MARERHGQMLQTRVRGRRAWRQMTQTGNDERERNKLAMVSRSLYHWPSSLTDPRQDPSEPARARHIGSNRTKCQNEKYDTRPSTTKSCNYVVRLSKTGCIPWYTLMRYMSMRHTPVRYTPMRCTPIRYMPMRYACEIHAHAMHAHVMHACEMHAHEVHAHELHVYEIHV
jgi:hypothetical protein